jgi:dUTP pyrophosphatase
MVTVRFVRLNPRATLPHYMTEGAAGCDVTACIEEPLELGSLQRAAVPTGLAVEIPRGYEIQVRPRSGLAFKHGITVVNAPGTIDSDYRGEVRVLLVNLSAETVRIDPGERIAQLVLQRVELIHWEAAPELAPSARGAGGFGSTGRAAAPEDPGHASR